MSVVLTMMKDSYEVYGPYLGRKLCSLGSVMETKMATKDKKDHHVGDKWLFVGMKVNVDVC